MHCGQTLRLLRQYKGISQQTLAKKMNVKQQMISYWEKLEHLKGKTLEQLLKALNSNNNEWEQFKKLPPPK